MRQVQYHGANTMRDLDASRPLRDLRAALVVIVTTVVVRIMSPQIGVAAFTLEALLVASIYQHRGILNPIAWFAPAYCAYSISFAIFALNFPTESYGNLLDYIFVTQVGFVGFWVAQLFNARPTRPARFPSLTQFEYFAFFGLIAVALGVLIYVQGIHVENKRQLTDAAARILYAFLALSLFAIHIIAVQTARQRVNWWLILAVYGILTLSFLITGERDILFRVILCHVFLYFTYNRPGAYKSYKLFLVFLAAVIVMPAFQMLKGVLLYSNSGLTSWDLYQVLHGEFNSNGKNLSIIMSSGIGGMHGETLVWDLKTVLSFLFPDQMSPVEWYNVYVRRLLGVQGTSGWGFSLPAEGYLNFGTIGVFVWMFITGLVARLFHRLSNRSSIWFSLYLCEIPVIIYCFRADFANLANLTLKVNVLLFFCVWLLQKMSARRGPEKRLLTRALPPVTPRDMPHRDGFALDGEGA